MLDATFPARPGQDQDCVAWGYARREQGVDPLGSPAAFRFQGVEGDGLLSLKAGISSLGLSGAPLVCPERRAVVGVMTATRNPTDDLGGWASPIWPLNGGSDAIPAELIRFGKQVLEANRAAVLGDRAAWHTVLPVADRESLDGELVTWGEYTKGHHSDPADLLLPEYRVVKYLFRDEDLARLESWCLGKEPASIALIPGVGGSGKTRLAVELCVAMRGRGWVAGETQTLSEALLARLLETPLPRLVVIDYVEAQPPDLLRTWLGRLSATASAFNPVRVLLLNRERAGIAGSPGHTVSGLMSEATVSVRRLLDDREEPATATTSLDEDQRNVLFRQALTAFAGAWGREVPVVDPLLTDESHTEPLGVLFDALLYVLADDETVAAPELSRGPFWGSTPAERVLAHEEKYWTQTAPAGEEKERSLLRKCVALATLTGASSQADVDEVLCSLPDLADDDAQRRRADLSVWLRGLYGGGQYVNPLQPDRLGDAMVVTGPLCQAICVRSRPRVPRDPCSQRASVPAAGA